MNDRIVLQTLTTMLTMAMLHHQQGTLKYFYSEMLCFRNSSKEVATLGTTTSRSWNPKLLLPTWQQNLTRSVHFMPRRLPLLRLALFKPVPMMACQSTTTWRNCFRTTKSSPSGATTQVNTQIQREQACLSKGLWKLDGGVHCVA